MGHPLVCKRILGGYKILISLLWWATPEDQQDYDTRITTLWWPTLGGPKHPLNTKRHTVVASCGAPKRPPNTNQHAVVGPPRWPDAPKKG